MLSSLFPLENDMRLKTILAILSVSLLAIITIGVVWFFVAGTATPAGIGWYLFSFAAGLTMIVLPCTLPLAFVIVPLSMGKGVVKGLGMAIALSATHLAANPCLSFLHACT